MTQEAVQAYKTLIDTGNDPKYPILSSKFLNDFSQRIPALVNRGTLTKLESHEVIEHIRKAMTRASAEIRL